MPASPQHDEQPTVTSSPDTSPYDALLLVSFGGPEKPDDVVPFLENVTRGRGIPRERLEEVGEHYFLFGGRSPINDQNREFLAALREDLKGAGIDLPVYWGNRNWDPYLADTLRQMAADGITRAACFMTSAYSSYSSCRQYRENLADAVAEVPEAPRLDKLRHYFNHPGFVEAVVDATLAALAELPDVAREGAHLVFVTHSIPVAMNDTSGPDGGRLRRPAPQRRPGGRRPGARGDRPRGTPTSWSSARARAPRTSRGWSPTSTTTSGAAGQGRARAW